MDLQLNDRTALITGASTGIGAGIAQVLATQGLRIAISARRGEWLERLADRIEAAGAPRPHVLPADICDPSQVVHLAQQAQAVLGRVDILVNTAGGTRPTSHNADDAFWDEALNLNFQAGRRLTQALLPAMRERGYGRVLNFSGSMEPRQINAASAAKAAIQVWAKGLACEVAGDGVTVNTISPGRINSEQILERVHPTEEARQAFIARHIPIGYFGDPEDVGHLVAFLASPLARYITGEVIAVDGGMHAFAH